MTKKERFEGILAWFGENMPVAETELHYRSPYELLVAVMLSAQCTDKRVNIVTPALFAALPTVEAMAQASQEEILALIKSISYPNSKAEHLSKMAQRVVQTFGGSIPATREELMTLPGVGRKTANVILAVLYNQPTMAVDTRALYPCGANSQGAPLAHLTRPVRLFGTLAQMLFLRHCPLVPLRTEK